MTDVSIDVATRETMYRRLAHQVRNHILACGFIRSSCILTTRVLLRVFEERGIDASAFPVRAIAMNAQCALRYNAGTFCAPLLPGEWNVALGYALRSVSDGYNGHLVVRTRDDYLVDASLDQCNRPTHGLEVPRALVGRAPADFWANNGVLAITLSNDCVVEYRAKLRARDFKRALDWRWSAKHDALLATLRLWP